MKKTLIEFFKPIIPFTSRLLIIVKYFLSIVFGILASVFVFLIGVAVVIGVLYFIWIGSTG